jgi:hypothetical protein
MKTTFEQTISILIKAYFDNTLFSGYCEACAIGNLVAHANNYKILKINDSVMWDNGTYTFQAKWGDVFKTTSRGKQYIDLQHFKGQARKEIISTGYTLEELVKIEYVFEKAYNKTNFLFWKKVDRMFNALCAVVDVLADIHQIENNVRQSTKLMFVKQ